MILTKPGKTPTVVQPLLTAALFLFGCSEPPGTECRWTDDCRSGEFCRLGSCVAGLATADASDVSGSPIDTGPNRTEDENNSGSSSAAETGEQTDHPCPDASTPESGNLILNELLAHVPTGAVGDANGDGVRDPFDDEFVELVNRSSSPLDLTGTRLVEGGTTVMTLQKRCLAPSGTLVIFGGVETGMNPTVPDGIQSAVSPKRFGFANSGSSFTLVAPDGTKLDALKWSSAPAESFTRSPQISGEKFQPHSTVEPSAVMSPGTCSDGSPLSEGCEMKSPITDTGPDTSTDAG